MIPISLINIHLGLTRNYVLYFLHVITVNFRITSDIKNVTMRNYKLKNITRNYSL